jgi:hypothetical protein
MIKAKNKQLKKRTIAQTSTGILFYIVSFNEVPGGWRNLHNEELHGLYSSPSIVRVIKARRMRWARHVASMGEVRDAYNILA